MNSALKYIILLGLVFSCQDPTNGLNRNPENIGDEVSWTPQYHFAPPHGWMNDPNGLLFHNDTYHLFYQHYPHANVWGPMHWGHATSKDLKQWKHEPIAMYPDEHGAIFSGSAVVDVKNTSGLGTEGKPPMIAMFTYFKMGVEKSGGIETQSQGLAYSLDEGKTWEKYQGNPVIPNPGIKDFRDPKVFWHESTQRWKMVLVAGDHAKVYQSKNLIDWEYLSDFGKDKGAHGGVWECPDLFPMQVNGETKWVLLISIGGGGPNGGTGTQYFVGDFDGERFTTEQEEIEWLDWGTDNYAGVTFNGTEEKDRIFIGWMSNWQYALKTPAEDFRSFMTMPRYLDLGMYDGAYELQQKPVDYPNDSKGDASISANLKPNETTDRIVLEGVAQKIDLKMSNRDFKITLGNDKGEQLVYIWDKIQETLMVDRTQSGLTDFHYEFGNKLHYMVTQGIGETLEIKLYVDRTSSELFLDRGRFAMSTLCFPKSPYTYIQVANLSRTLPQEISIGF